MDHRALLRMLSAGRIAVGSALLAAPRTAARGWVGEAADAPGSTILARALGVRDLALGAGTLRALEAGDPVRSWAQLGAVCDAVDLAATVLAVRQVGLRRAIPVMVVAGSAAAVGWASAEHVDS